MAPSAAPKRAPRQADLAPAHAITRRAVLLGSVATFANAAWVAYMEPIKAAGRTTIVSLFFASVFTLLVLVAVNRAIRRRRPRHAQSQAEILTVYVMANFGVALIGVDFLQVLVPMMGSPVYLATPANRWGILFVERSTLSTSSTPRSLVGFGLFLWFNRAYRSHPMGFQLEGLKLAERERIAGDAMARVMLLAGFLGMPAGFWALLTPYYRLGIGTADVIGNPRASASIGA